MNNNKEILVTLDTITEEQVKEALRLLNAKLNRKVRIAKGELVGTKKWADMTKEEQDRAKFNNKKRAIEIRLLAQKALEAGFNVTDEEVNQELPD